jgi:adenylate cyclase
VLVATGSLVVALIAGTLLYVGVQANSFVGDRLVGDLRRTQEQIRSDEQQRFAALRSTAQVLASFPELRALLATDAATIRDFLLDYQKRTGSADLLLLLDPAGSVVARTDALAAIEIPDAQGRWVQPVLAGQPAIGLLESDTGTYEAAAAPASAGGTVFGFLIVGQRIDDGFARRLRDATRDEIVVLDERRVLGSTIEPRLLPFASAGEWRAVAAAGGAPAEVSVGTERYAALASDSLGGPAVVLLGLQSRDRAMAPYRHIQRGLLALGLLGALAGLAASAWLARSMTAPLETLTAGTQRVAAGEFDFSLEETRGDEFGDLARSFNLMTRGLRERADMQKFVSQSTVAMIQADASRRESAGERKTLTILVSDIRGFTAFAETRAPEEVITRLNRFLGVQAECVQRFGGDVDKYVGDSVVALFSGEDMALRAIRCAVEIHRAVEGQSGDAGLQVGVGLATGEVVLGSIGSHDRQDFTVVGTPVNLASRLCAAASRREILMAESTFADVRGLVAAERLDPMPIRGLNQPVVVYRMVAG